ncbi:amidohydrolase [Microbacterium sp.]|uniref:amidohydrolase family protein n=1 Tax=Microbacterium sp. TaxID=51671 RepID=UPI0026116533|nr:amidohydrolase [Microbacterium sp.]
MSATVYARAALGWMRNHWREDMVYAISDERVRPATETEHADQPIYELDAAVLPPLTDAHAHLGLARLPDSGPGSVARVLDLGGAPRVVATLAADAREAACATELHFVGAFLTAPGGYPSDRSWAPASASIPLATPDEAVAAVRGQHAVGAKAIKVTANSMAGPVLSDALLQTIADETHRRGLRLIAHAEGEGQAERAHRHGVDVFAHTPWTHRLDDDTVQQMAANMTWISTLGMHSRGGAEHDLTVALDNLTRFVQHGGTVVYGTDAGNGLDTVMIHQPELDALTDAGVSPADLVHALTAPSLLPRWGATVSLAPSDLSDHNAAWLAHTTPVHASHLKERLR